MFVFAQLFFLVVGFPVCCFIMFVKLFCVCCFVFVGFIVTLRGAARGSLFRLTPRRRGIFKRFVRTSKLFGARPCCQKSSPKYSKNLSKTSPNPPQILPKSTQIDPKSVGQASWRPSWNRSPQRIDFGGSKLPKCAKMVPKWRPKWIQNQATI